MYLVMDGQWERLVACLAGFLLMRIVLTRLLGLGEVNRASPDLRLYGIESRQHDILHKNDQLNATIVFTRRDGGSNHRPG
jgi:hypothetical protein